MLHSHSVASWDAFETPRGDVVVVIPPSPRPVAIEAVVGRGVVVVTDSVAIALTESVALADVVLRARTVVVAEADERISRETLVPRRSQETQTMETPDVRERQPA